MNLRKYAEGKWCMIRIPRICRASDTVVLCHVRPPGTGIGRKASDLTAFWGCADCHDVYDGRRKTDIWDRDDLDDMGWLAVARTHDQYDRDGLRMEKPE